MISILARFKMQPDKEQQALEQIRKMAEAVEANEPGCLVYLMHRSLSQPEEIFVFEVYEDEAAFEAHRRTPHMEEMQAGFASLMDPASFNIERLDRMAGFIR